MTFNKTGDVVIAKVLCACGHDLSGAKGSCPSCGKAILPDTKTDTPAAKNEKDKEKDAS